MDAARRTYQECTVRPGQPYEPLATRIGRQEKSGALSAVHTANHFEPNKNGEMSVFIKTECDEEGLAKHEVLNPSHKDGAKYNEAPAVIKTEYEDKDAGTTQSLGMGLGCPQEDSLIDNGALKKKVENGEMRMFIKTEVTDENLTEAAVDPGHMVGTRSSFLPNKYNGTPTVVKTEDKDEDAGTTQRWNAGLTCLQEDSLVDNDLLKKKECGETPEFIKIEYKDQDLAEPVVTDPGHVDGNRRSIIPIKNQEASMVIETKYEDKDTGTAQKCGMKLGCLQEDSFIDSVPVEKKMLDPTLQKLKISSGDSKRKIQENIKESVETDSSDDDKRQKKINEIIEKRKLQNRIRCQRYRNKKKTEAIINSQNPKPRTITVEEEEIIKRRKERGRQKSQRYRDKKRAINLLNIQIDQSSKTAAKNLYKCQNTPNSKIAGSSTRNVSYFPSTLTAGLSIWNDSCIPESHSNYGYEIRNNVPLQVPTNHVPQLDEPTITNYRSNTENIHTSNVQDNTQNMDSQHNFLVQTKVNLQISKPSSVTVEEEKLIRHRKEKGKQKSQHYRDKKRATSLINLQVVQSSKTVVNYFSELQNFNDSQIAGPSKRNMPYFQTIHTAGLSTRNEPYIPESILDCDVKFCYDVPLQVPTNHVPELHKPTIINCGPNTHLPSDAENNTQNMDIQHNLCVQTYSSFQRNSSAHREFQKDFFENDFGHACDICDRLWFKKDLKFFVNNNTTPNIEFIRTMLTNANVAEVKMCSTCLATIKKNRVPPLSVYNGFKYPPFPENLKKIPLDLVTKRLISPRIPFLQIRRLRHVHGQFDIYGQVINIPTEVNTMVFTLPRNLDDDCSITVHIKKRKIHKFSHIYDIFNERKIKAWLQYLKDTPLYISYGIRVDDNFLNGQDHAQNEITCDEDGDNDISEQISVDESLIAQQQTLMWNHEMYLRIAPCTGNLPISLLFDDHAEELAFPEIYLGQSRNFRDGVTVTPLMMARSELRRSDRRGVSSQHLLYLAMKIMRIRIRDSLSIAFKQGKDTTVTKGQVESDNYVYDCIESNLAFLRTIPNSIHYWSETKKDLFAMIRQFGKPTVFFTVSANEIGWPELLQLLHNLKNNSKISVEDVTALHFIEKSTLINEDAVTCAIFFNKLVNVLMKILQSKRFSPFQKHRILYYYKRIEFQQRGSPDAHIFAWLDNAPEDTLGRDYEKSIDLIDFLMSVSAAEASGNIELQTHKHTFTCCKGLASRRMQNCRFEAPFMPIKTTMILAPMKNTEDGFEEYKAKYNALRKKLENCDYDDFETFYEDNNINSDWEYINIIRAGINRPIVFPKRQLHEKWYNPFNPFILNIVKSSTHFQFITEEYSCAAYIMEYVNKTNRTVSDLQRKIIEVMDENPEFDIFQIAKNININLLNHTEMTSQEAAWYLLKEPTSKSSNSIIYVPTIRPIERQRIKKTMKDLNELDDDGTDIWKENWFDKYEKRPEDLEDVSLAQFVSKYYKNDKGNYVKRDDLRVLRYRNYDMVTDSNEYKREMVTLHIPFRHEEAEILEEMKFVRLYDENLDLILEKRKEFESNIDIEKILQICRQLCHEEISDDNEEVRDVDRLPDQNKSISQQINKFKKCAMTEI